MKKNIKKIMSDYALSTCIQHGVKESIEDEAGFSDEVEKYYMQLTKQSNISYGELVELQALMDNALKVAEDQSSNSRKLTQEEIAEIITDAQGHAYTVMGINCAPYGDKKKMETLGNLVVEYIREHIGEQSLLGISEFAITYAAEMYGCRCAAKAVEEEQERENALWLRGI